MNEGSIEVGDKVEGREASGKLFRGVVTESLTYSVVLDEKFFVPHKLIQKVGGKRWKQELSKR